METNIDYLKMVSRGCSDCIRSKAGKKSILKCPLMHNPNGTSEVEEHLYIPDGNLFVRKKTWTSGRAKRLLDQINTFEREIKEKAQELLPFDHFIEFDDYEIMSHSPGFYSGFDENTYYPIFKGIYGDYYDDRQYFEQLIIKYGDQGPKESILYLELYDYIKDRQSTLFEDLYPDHPGLLWWNWRLSNAIEEFGIIGSERDNQVYAEPGEKELNESLTSLIDENVLCKNDNVEYVLNNMIKQDEDGIWRWKPSCHILKSKDKNGETRKAVVPVTKNCPTFGMGEKTCKHFEWNIGYPGISVNGNRLKCPDYILKHTHVLSLSVEWVTPYSIYREIENEIRNCTIPDIYKNALVIAFEESKIDAERAEKYIREQADTFCRIMTGKGLYLDENGGMPTPQTASILEEILKDTNNSLSPLSTIEKLDYSVQQKLYTVWMLIRTSVFHEVLKEKENCMVLLHEIRKKLESATGVCHHDNLFLYYYDIMDRNMGMHINDWVNTYIYLVETRDLEDLYDVSRLPPYCPAHVRFVLSEIHEDGDTNDFEVVHEIGHFHEQESYLLTERTRHYKYYVDYGLPQPDDEFVDSLKEFSDSINCDRQTEKYTRGIRLIRNGDGIFDWITDLYMKVSQICGLEGDLYNLENEINACKRAAIDAGICDAKLHVRTVSKLADFLVYNNYVRIDNPREILGKKRTLVSLEADEIVSRILKVAHLNWNKFDGVFFSKKGKPIMGDLLQDAFTKKDIDFREPVYQLLLKLFNSEGTNLQATIFSIKIDDKEKRLSLQDIKQIIVEQGNNLR